MTLYGAIEARGTKFVCTIAGGPDEIQAEIILPTQTPDKTLTGASQFFTDYQTKTGKKISALGIACFGPIDLDKCSSQYGYITKTPKLDWVDTEVVGFFRRSLNVPVGFDTDVNAAAYGECLWGAGKGLDVVIYLTIGTGIGGGAYVYGKPLHGLMHPEMGHLLIRPNAQKDTFEGLCPYHKNCLEGMASGRAVDVRWGSHASELADDHPAWDLEADYLSQGLMSYILTLSPQKIIIGGGLMHRNLLYPLVRTKVQGLLNGYLPVKMILEEMDDYIVAPGLGTRSGISGAIGLAMQALKG